MVHAQYFRVLLLFYTAFGVVPVNKLCCPYMKESSTLKRLWALLLMMSTAAMQILALALFSQRKTAGRFWPAARRLTSIVCLVGFGICLWLLYTEPDVSAGHLLVSYGVGLHCVQPEPVPYWRMVIITVFIEVLTGVVYTSEVVQKL